MRKGLAVIVVLIASLFAVNSAGAAVSVWDNFKTGMSIGAPGSSAKWFYFGAAGFVGDDGVAVTGRAGGVLVAPPARNPATGLPMFTKTVAQEQESGLPGGFDHVKWLVYMNHFSSYGYPGFDAVPGKRLVCQSTVAGQT